MDYDQYPEPPDLSTIAQTDAVDPLQPASNQIASPTTDPKAVRPDTDNSSNIKSDSNRKVVIQIAIVICILSVSLAAGFLSKNKTTNRVTSIDNSEYVSFENDNQSTTPKTTTIESNTDTTTETETKSAEAISIYDMTKVAHGDNHDCGIYTDNKAYCWGGGAYGQLGAGPNILSSDNPIAVIDTGVLANLTIKEIAAGSNHTCVIASDNQAYCWGVGTYGQMGDGLDIADNYLPRAVYRLGALKDKTLVEIDATRNYTCATASDEHTYCWGLGIFGKDDNQNLKSNSFPTLVH